MMHRPRRGAGRAGALAWTLVPAAGSGDGGGGADGGGSGEQAPSGSHAVSLTDFALNPEQLTAPTGQELVFEVSNDGQSPHTFGVDTGNGVKGTGELQSGETGPLAVPPLEAGG